MEADDSTDSTDADAEELMTAAIRLGKPQAYAELLMSVIDATIASPRARHALALASGTQSTKQVEPPKIDGVVPVVGKPFVILVHPDTEKEMVDALRGTGAEVRLFGTDGEAERELINGTIGKLGCSMRIRDLQPTLMNLMPFERLNDDGTTTLSSEPFVKPNEPWYNRHRQRKGRGRR